MKLNKFLGFGLGFIFLTGFALSGNENQEAQPVRDPVKTGDLEVPDGKLYYEVAGEGDWLVLVHDGNLHSVTWDEQFPVFSKSYKVVRYDRRGYGRSAYPEKPYSNIDDLAEVFRQLNIPKATLMGMSAGGGLVIDFTLEHPDRVTGLVLVGAVVSGMGYTDHFRTRGGNLDPAIVSDPAKFADYMCHRDPYTFYEGNPEARKRGYEYLRASLQNYRMEKFGLLQGPKRPALPNLKEIKVPALIVVGEYDIPDCHAHAGAMEAGISGSKRVIINKAGHIVPLEQPAVFNEIALTFLRENKFFEILGQKGVSEAVRAYEEALKKNDHSVYFSEPRLNQVGYDTLQSGKVKEAIDLFKLNVLAYPDSWNTYDSLAEAYMMDGNKELAIAYYEKSLKLNPGNENAVIQLKKLRQP
jgi:pimeloyl-ACP methyl ester carboxylesterase